ncbi:hypothetical protein ROHU_005548 [Labeo rohita]|uniref:Uncharacterized protein n=1 Tax=Labeo rohita TaxID=84645 RepID=A0A498N8A9_LABRO|nr:hypothetical protein ROHU_005548 [Labeo rohita]
MDRQPRPAGLPHFIQKPIRHDRGTCKEKKEDPYHPDHTAKSVQALCPQPPAMSLTQTTDPPPTPRLHPSHPPIPRLHPKPGIPSVQLCTSSPFCLSIQKST